MDEAINSFPEQIFDNEWKNNIGQCLNDLAFDLNNLDSTTLDIIASQQPTVSSENTICEAFQSNSHVIISPIHLPSQIPTVDSNVQVSSSLPAGNDWPGENNFSVSFNLQRKNTKGVTWTYSRMLNKVFVKKDVPCPVNFSANTILPDDVCIRAVALYSSPEFATEIVRRCYNHSEEEVKSGKVEARHLIRCESDMATYQVDASGRHSVVVPFENPPAGQQYSTYLFKFACFGSCVGGPNRRPLMMVFTLERNNEVIGRRKMDLKICACPGRDKKTEETQYLARETPDHPAENSGKRKLNSKYVNLSEVMDFTKNVNLPPTKKSKVSASKDGTYILNTEDKRCYEFLEQMKKLYEICNTVGGIPPEVLSQTLQQIRKVKSEKKD